MADILKNLDFSGQDLSNADGNDFIFFRCKFDRANLTNSTFEQAQFIYCSFNRTLWEKSNLSHAKFRKDDKFFPDGGDCKENYKKLLEKNDGVSWPDHKKIKQVDDISECTGRLSSFHRSNLFCVSFCGYELDDSDFSESDLSGASFIDTCLNHCNFQNIKFVNECGNTDSHEKIVLFGAETSLEFADFSGTNLQGLHFKHCKTLEAANFKRSDLKGAIFEGNNKPESLMSLYRVCFDNTRLTKAVFKDCDLDSSSFIASDLRQVVFDGLTKGKAAIFLNSYLAGCQAKKIDFTAANFSGSFIGTDTEDGIIPASFVGATLTSAIFSNAALIGVNFDNAKMKLVDFEAATFTTEKRISEADVKLRDSDNYKQTMSFNGTNLEKTVFRSVNLNGYHFIDCKADGAIFDLSELQYVKFIKTSLKGSSFEDCYLFGAEFYPERKISKDNNGDLHSELSMESSVFSGSNLESSEFHRANIVSSDFTDANLRNVMFDKSILTGSTFKNASLENAIFDRCNLYMVTFEKIDADKMQIQFASDMSACQFSRTHGKDIEITIDKYSVPQAVVFRLTQLSGKIQAKIKGAIIEYSDFKLCSDSELECNAGCHCEGSAFDVKGKMIVKYGLINNSTINADSCKQLTISSSTLKSSAIQGLTENCSFPSGSTFESCNLGAGWSECTFENVKINLTSIDTSMFGKHAGKLSLESIKNIDRNSIASLKANAESMGDSKLSGDFFDLEKEKEIEEENEKIGWLIAASFFALIFFIMPGAGYYPQFYKLFNDTYYGLVIIMLMLCLIFSFVFQSKITFFKFLYRYGYSLLRISRSIILIITCFSFSYFLNALSSGCKLNYDTCFHLIKNSFHQSVSSFFAIGFWDAVPGPTGVMIFYSNIETMLGIISMALIVTTIINNSTSGK